MKNRIHVLLGTLLLWQTATIAYAADGYKVVPTSSAVRFSLAHIGGRAKGVFETYQGTLNFSKAHPETSSVKFDVDVASVETKNSNRDDHLRGDEYFAAAAHPKMSFQSKAFKKVGEGKYMVTGPLTIKGHVKNISVPITLARSGITWATGEEVLRFQGSFEVDRTEFGVGESSNLLGSDVKVDLDLEFRGSK